MKLKLPQIIYTLALFFIIYSAGCSKNSGSSASIVGQWDVLNLRVVQKQSSIVLRDSLYPYHNDTMTFTSDGRYTYAGRNNVSGTYTLAGNTLILTQGGSSNINQINTLADHSLQTQYTVTNAPFTTDYIYSYSR
jgi:hypothetical protein